MLRYLYWFLLVIFLAGNINTSYAAFPVIPGQPVELSATPVHLIHKTFSERRIPRLLHRAEEKIFSTPKKAKQKTAWPGIVSLSAGLLAIGALFTLPVLCIPLMSAAIVTGAMGLSRKRHRLVGLAYAGMFLGILEYIALGLLIIALISALKNLTIGVM